LPLKTSNQKEKTRKRKKKNNKRKRKISYFSILFIILFSNKKKKKNPQHRRKNNKEIKHFYHSFTSTVGGATRSPPNAYSIACSENHARCSKLGNNLFTSAVASDIIIERQCN
jgi:hypothetical protein